MKNYYMILGVSPLAEISEIKAAYRSLAKKHHPDVVGNDPEKKKLMYEIQEAYQIIGDEKRRREYDKKRRQAAQAGSGHRRFAGSENTEKKETKGSRTEGWTGPLSGQEQFQRFFGFSPGKGMGTYKDRKKGPEKPDGPMKPEERFASFFKKMK